MEALGTHASSSVRHSERGLMATLSSTIERLDERDVFVLNLASQPEP